MSTSFSMKADPAVSGTSLNEGTRDSFPLDRNHISVRLALELLSNSSSASENSNTTTTSSIASSQISRLLASNPSSTTDSTKSWTPASTPCTSNTPTPCSTPPSNPSSAVSTIRSLDSAVSWDPKQTGDVPLDPSILNHDLHGGPAGLKASTWQIYIHLLARQHHNADAQDTARETGDRETEEELRLEGRNLQLQLRRPNRHVRVHRRWAGLKTERWCEAQLPIAEARALINTTTHASSPSSSEEEMTEAETACLDRAREEEYTYHRDLYKLYPPFIPCGGEVLSAAEMAAQLGERDETVEKLGGVPDEETASGVHRGRGREEVWREYLAWTGRVEKDGDVRPRTADDDDDGEEEVEAVVQALAGAKVMPADIWQNLVG